MAARLARLAGEAPLLRASPAGGAAAAARALPTEVAGQGPETLFFVHGWPDSARLWDAQVAHLRGEYRCVSVTMPHFLGRAAAARSGDRPEGYDFSEVAELLAATVRKECQGRPACLVLHDWGCIWGFLLQEKYPELVKVIVAIDVGHPSGIAAGWRTLPMVVGAGLLYQYWLLAAYLLSRAAAKAPHFLGFVRPLADHMVRLLVRFLRPVAGKADAADLRGLRITADACYPYYFFQSRWGIKGAAGPTAGQLQPSCPCLFLYGCRNKPVNFHSAAWQRHLQSRSDCRVEAIEAGHWMMLEKPELINRLVQSWLRSTLSGPPEGAAPSR